MVVMHQRSTMVVALRSPTIDDTTGYCPVRHDPNDDQISCGPSTTSTTTKRRSSPRSAVPYGDGRCPSPDYTEWDISPSNSSDTASDLMYSHPHQMARHRSIPIVSSFSSTNIYKKNIVSPPQRQQHRPRQLNPFVYKVMTVFIALSWLVASVIWIRSVRDLHQLKFHMKSGQLQVAHLIDSIQEIAYAVNKEQKLVASYKKTKTILQHEIRVFQELSDVSEVMFPLEADSDKALVQEWLEHRQFGLQRKIDRLAKHLQNVSRYTILQKYGRGPHRVKFTIDLYNTYDIAPQVPPNTNSFVVELANIDLMPHSVHFFLDLVTAKAWDNTIFVHREKVDHVVAAAPIDYRTHRIKQTHLHELGWAELGFPEYSRAYPHQMYTIGFSGEGPTFYINTVDNTNPHGPGGQGHHLLPADADPCFGVVVEGHDVVEMMINLASSERAVSLDGDHPWANEDHKWTHIISIELEGSS